MKPIDIVILAIVGVILVGVIAYLIWKKTKGENVGCGCGCNGCSGCGSASVCPTAQKATQETETDEQSTETDE